MKVDRREFCGFGVAAMAAGTSARAQSHQKPAAIGAARSLAAFPEADFYGVAADFDEINEAQARLKGDDLESYLEAWGGLGATVAKEADGFLKDGRRASAHEAYLRASNYYSRAQQGLLRVGDGERILPLYTRMRDYWAKAWTLAKPPFEWVQNPLQEDHTSCALHGGGPMWRRPAAGGDRVQRLGSHSRAEFLPFEMAAVPYPRFELPGAGRSGSG